MSRNVSRRGLENALRDAKVPKKRFRDLRHTHCSLLISEGLNVDRRSVKRLQR